LVNRGSNGRQHQQCLSAQIWPAAELKDVAKVAAYRNGKGYNIYVSPPLLQFDRDPL
jgi:hypothetical protein